MSDKKLTVDDFKWIDNNDKIGEMLFTFDGEKIFNLFADYPYKLSEEERRVFDEANPFWADFFKDRTT
jgi:hypothetical protein